MSSDIDRFQAYERAVTDVCEWLDLERDGFYDLARRWDELGAELWTRTGPDSFYTAWTGDAGRANLCANVVDQFSRGSIWHVLSGVLTSGEVHFFLDYGCGTAVLDFPFLHLCRSAVLIDLPNLAQEFVRWRIEKHGLRDAAVLEPDALAAFGEEAFDVVACVDVLEHLPRPTEKLLELDRVLRPGGLLIHRSPWAKEDEELHEHLPEATADWHRPGGGEMILAAEYVKLAGLEFGGVYRKGG